MKNIFKFLFVLLPLFGFFYVSTKGFTHISKMPHKHKVKVLVFQSQEHYYSDRYYITSEIKHEGNCISFECIDNYDWEGTEYKTVCGNFTIEY